MDVWPTTANCADIPKVVATIPFDRIDFNQIVGRYGPVPFEPILPTIRHGIRQLNIDNSRSLPMATPPLR